MFACFNANYKIEPAVFDDWMRVLARVPGSVLWLLQTAPATVANLRREAAARGIDPGAIVFAEMTDKPRHLARHRLARLFLDTPFCNAHTTASRCAVGGPAACSRAPARRSRRAWPRACRRGRAARADGARPRGVRRDGVRLAATRRALATLTARLRADPARLPLFDTARTVRQLERAFCAMRDRRRRGEEPSPFDVDS